MIGQQHDEISNSYHSRRRSRTSMNQQLSSSSFGPQTQTTAQQQQFPTVYRLHFACDNIGKTFASSKRKIVW